MAKPDCQELGYCMSFQLIGRHVIRQALFVGGRRLHQNPCPLFRGINQLGFALVLFLLSFGSALGQPVMKDRDLSGNDFSHRNLDSADLSGAILRGASFHDATLRRANLQRADLRGADFTNADLTGADLRGAIGPITLQNVKADGANLSGIEIRGSLEGSSLRGADLRGGDLSAAYIGENVATSPLIGAVIDATTRMPGRLLGERTLSTAPALPPPRLEEVRRLRHEVIDAGTTAIEEPGNRTILRESGIIRHVETDRLRRIYGPGIQQQRGDLDYIIVRRPDGREIVSIQTRDGRLYRRFARLSGGQELVLIDHGISESAGVPLAFEFLQLLPPVIDIPPDQYVVSIAHASEADILEAFMAPPLYSVERAYSLEEIYLNKALRDRMRSVDLDTITFEFGSWALEDDQISHVAAVAEAIRAVLARDPGEVFLVEGYTDAVGSDEDNLTLSDRRAETVASMLSQRFGVPAENLTIQGYGKRYRKVPTDGPNRANRRVMLRRITPLLRGVASR